MSVQMILPAKGGKPAQAFGTVAEFLLANNMNVEALRLVTNSTLRKDEWKKMDAAVLKASRLRMRGVADLKKRGCTYDLGNAMATMVFEYERVSQLGRAHITMDGEVQGQRDRLTFDVGYLPIPIIFQDYSFNARVLANIRARGSNLDTTTAEEASATVAEELEYILFQGGSSFEYGQGILYGYTDYPDRNTGNFTDWLESGADPVEDCRDLKQQLIGQRFFGPYVMYIPTEYETILDRDYITGQPSKTMRQRILEIGGIEEINVCDHLAAGTLLMVNMTPNVVRMVGGMPITSLEWKEGAGMRSYFKVMTIDVPQIRSDKSGRCGVSHWTKS